MKKENIKDFKKRMFVYKEEKKNLLLKFVTRSTELPKKLRHWAQIRFLKKSSPNFSKIRTKNRCIFTARSKSINKNMEISRITFRKLISEGLLVGIKKSSW